MKQLNTIDFFILGTYYVTQHQLHFIDARHLLWIYSTLELHSVPKGYLTPEVHIAPKAHLAPKIHSTHTRFKINPTLTENFLSLN